MWRAEATQEVIMTNALVGHLPTLRSDRSLLTIVKVREK